MTARRPIRRLTAAEQDAQQLALPITLRTTMTEASLLAAVRQLAKHTGWLAYHTHDSRRSEPGFPDLVLVHGRRRRLLFAELKTDTGHTTPEQEAWIATLLEAGQTVALWRPADLDDEIRAILTGYRELPDLTHHYRDARN